MTVYVIAQLTITDRAAYAEYQSRFMAVFKPFGGTLLAVDDDVKTIEGDWHHTRLVLASFPDESAFRSWWDSPAYREIVKHRWAAAGGPIVLVRGLQQPSTGTN